MIIHKLQMAVVGGACLASLVVPSGVFADDDRNREAAAIFDNKKLDDMVGGTWKVVYSSAEGPQGRALETLTERVGFHVLRERHISTSMVLPLEKDGEPPLRGKRDSIVKPDTHSAAFLVTFEQ